MPLQTGAGQVCKVHSVLGLLGVSGQPPASTQKCSLHLLQTPSMPLTAPQYPRLKLGILPSCVTLDDVTLLACQVMQALEPVCDGGELSTGVQPLPSGVWGAPTPASDSAPKGTVLPSLGFSTKASL